MSNDCVFCKIIKGEIPVKEVYYEDEEVFAFSDLAPQAPMHIIIVPKKHIGSLKEVSKEDEKLLGHIQIAAAAIADKYPQMKNGFRLVNNCGADGGQTVFHLHYHLLGGRKFSWPAG